MRSDSGPQWHWREPYRCMWLQHGPIELNVEADGLPGECAAAFAQLVESFSRTLNDLVTELPDLRKPVMPNRGAPLRGTVAKRMKTACEPHASQFVTPMAAVAGAVADHLLDAMIKGRTLKRAFVNNGGDIAIYLNKHQHYDIGICEQLTEATMSSIANIGADTAIRGIATSGWQGRSHSLGIADAVTVLANNAACADVAATLIANEINVPNHPGVKRMAANELSPDSDLKTQRVTVAVPALSDASVDVALRNGQRYADRLVQQKLINSAFMSLQGRVVLTGNKHDIEWRRTA